VHQSGIVNVCDGNVVFETVESVKKQTCMNVLIDVIWVCQFTVVYWLRSTCCYHMSGVITDIVIVVMLLLQLFRLFFFWKC